MNATLTAAIVAAGLAGAAEPQTWTRVPVMDTVCYEDVKEAPDEHTTECALQCVAGGYGLITPEGQFLKLDPAGNQLLVAALKATERKDGLRATVVGEREGDTVRVSSIHLE